jgi:hypothetical protein
MSKRLRDAIFLTNSGLFAKAGSKWTGSVVVCGAGGGLASEGVPYAEKRSDLDEAKNQEKLVGRKVAEGIDS